MRNYLALPNLQNPKYIIPICNAKVAEASFKLYVPLTFRRKIQIAILNGLIKTKLIKHVFSKYLIDEKELQVNIKTMMLRPSLAKILKNEKIVFAFFTGTAGLYRKTTIQVMNNDGDILAYVKIADSDQSKERLQNEKYILEYLKSLRVYSGLVPEMIGFKEYAGVFTVVQSCLNGNFNFSDMQLDKRHVLFLSEIFSKTAKYQLFENSACFQIVSERISMIDNKLTSVWRETLKKGTEIVKENLGPLVIPLGLCHYDFKPWNIRIAKNSKNLFVFDWELAKTKWVPLWDLFHYIIQPAILVKKKKVHKIINELISPNQRYKTLIHYYMSSINLDSSFYKNLLLFYLCDVSSFYLEKQLMSNSRDFSEDFYIETLGQLLDLCIESK